MFAGVQKFGNGGGPRKRRPGPGTGTAQPRPGAQPTSVSPMAPSEGSMMGGMMGGMDGGWDEDPSRVLGGYKPPITSSPGTASGGGSASGGDGTGGYRPPNGNTGWSGGMDPTNWPGMGELEMQPNPMMAQLQMLMQRLMGRF